MKADIASLRATRAVCIGGALALWVLAAYSVYLQLGLEWLAGLSLGAGALSYLVARLTLMIRAVEEVYARRIQG